MGTPHDIEPKYLKYFGSEYDAPILIDPKNWVMPSGAFKENIGPS